MSEICVCRGVTTRQREGDVCEICGKEKITIAPKTPERKQRKSRKKFRVDSIEPEHSRSQNRTETTPENELTQRISELRLNETRNRIRNLPLIPDWPIRRQSLDWDNGGLNTPNIHRTQTVHHLPDGDAYEASTSESEEEGDERHSEERSEEEEQQEVGEEILQAFERRLRHRMEEDDHNNQPRGFRNIKLRVPQFSGKKTENVKHFLSKFRKYADFQNVEDDDMVEALGLCLESDALEFYDTLMRNNEEIGFEEVQDALITRFDDERIRLVIRAKINKRKLKAGESVTDFFNDIRRMGDKIDLDDESLLFSFINGLSPSAAEIIICQNPTTALDAFQLAKNVEQLKSLHGNEKEKISLESIKTELNNKVASASTGSDNYKNIKQEISEIKNMISQCLKRTENNTQNGTQNWSNTAAAQQQPAAMQASWQATEQSHFRPTFHQRNSYQNQGQPARQYFDNMPRFATNYNRRGRGWYSNGNQQFGPPQHQWRQNNQYQGSGNNNNWRQDTRQHENVNTFNRNNNNRGNNDGPLNRNQPREAGNQNAPGASVVQAPGVAQNAAAWERDVTSLSNDMSLRAAVNGKTFEALVDTGSAISLIGEDVITKIGEVTSITPSKYNKIIAVNNSETKIRGVARIRLDVMGVTVEWDFHIINGMSSNIILGRDFINNNIKSIDIEKGVVNIRDINGDACAVTIGGRKAKKPKQASAKAAKLIIIRPGHTSTAKIYPSNDILHPTLAFQENEWMKNKQIDVLTRTISGESSKMEIQMKNSSPQVVRIYPGRKIGTLTWYSPPKVGSAIAELKPITHKLPDRPDDDGAIEKLRKFLDSRRAVFAADMTELGEARTVKHEIKLTEDKIVRARYYRTDPVTQSKIDEHIQTMLDNKIIRPSTSTFASPCLVVDKKTPGETRFVTDFRMLNRLTQLDPQPIPLIQDILDGLGQSRYYSCVDLMAGYMQVPMHPDSIKYTAFVTKNGLFEYVRLAFGLKNSMATFQRLLNNVLRGLINKTCFCYVDDICTFSNNIDEHIERLSEIFDRLEKEGLKIRYDKCHWFQESITFVGFKVSKEGLRPDPKKVEVVRNYPAPESAKQVKSFLGLMSYFRRLIEGYSKIAHPLNETLKKDHQFRWTKECQEAFDSLKNKLINAPVLAFPDYSRQFIVTTDSSLAGLGFMLSQKDPEGIERPVAFGGKALNKHQKAYPIYQLEMLALVTAIEHFEQYLVSKPFVVFTDNTALIWLLRQNISKGRVSRWIMKLCNYDFEIFHKKGVQNLVADALSRLPNLPQSCVTKIQQRDPEMIRSKQREDSDVMEIINYFEKGEAASKKMAMRTAQNFILDKDQVLWYIYKGATGNEDPMKLVIPASMRDEVMSNFHDCTTAGHAGFFKTYGRIQERFWWARMYFDVKHFVESCETCATMKAKAGIQRAPLQTGEVENAFDRIQMDFTGPYIRCKVTNNAYILVITECLTGYVIACPVPEATAQQAAEQLFQQVLCTFGWIKTIQTDLGSHFCSKMMKAFYELIEAKNINSSAYCPRTMGKVEKMNGVLVGMLARVVADKADEWDRFVKPVTLAYNSSKHTTHGKPPFNLIFGRRCRMPGEYLDYEPPILESTEEGEVISRIAQNIHTAQETAKAIMADDKKQMKERYDEKNKTRMTEFNVGEKVLIKDGRRHKRKNPKFNKNFIGPFVVKEKIGPVTYRIDTKNNKKMADMIHVDRMKKWVDRMPTSMPKIPEGDQTSAAPKDTPQTPPQAPTTPLNVPESSTTPKPTPKPKPLPTPKPTLMNGNTPATSEIDESMGAADVTRGVEINNAPCTLTVINHRRKRNGLVYLVKREGEPDSTARWVKAEDSDYRKPIERYNKRNAEENVNTVRVNTMKRYTNSTRLQTCIHAIVIIMLFMLTQVTNATPEPVNNIELGSIFDCSKLSQTRLFATPKTDQCQRDILQTKTEVFKANVKQYRQVATYISIYYCDAMKFTKTCSEDFFGHDEKVISKHTVKVTAKQCQVALRSKISPYGQLKRSNIHTWTSKNEKAYNCAWLEHKKQEYTVFRMRQFRGRIVGEEDYVRQQITSSKCRINRRACRPVEQPLGVLAWVRTKHDRKVYHSLGRYEVHKFGKFILISALAISGAVIAKDQNTFLLDNTYLIERSGTHKHSISQSESFTNFTKQYAAHITHNVGRELLTAKITQEFMREDKAMSYIAAFVCRLRSNIASLQEHQIQAFPDTVDRLVTGEKGQTIRRKGDAFVLGKCKVIQRYNISWNHIWKGKCYQQLPIQMEDKGIKFLELHTRRVMRSSPRIDCHQTHNDTYVRDVKGQYWHYVKNEGFYKVKLEKRKTMEKGAEIPKLGIIDERIFNDEQNVPHRSTWLEMMAMHQDNLQDLLDFRTQGHGNFIVGLAGAMSDIVTDVVDVSENIFHIVATGSVDVVNDTTIAISSVTSAIADIFTLAGGPSVFILYVINVGILSYLLWMHCQRKRNGQHVIRYEINQGPRDSTDDQWSQVAHNLEVQSSRRDVRRRSNSS